MVTGEPDAPVRHTWAEVHERARCIAGGLARSRHRSRRRGRGAGRRSGRDSAHSPGHLDARCEPDNAASTHSTNRLGPLGRREHRRHRHDPGERGRRLRAVHGCGTRTGQRGFTRDHDRRTGPERTDRPCPHRRRRSGADAVDVRVDGFAQGRSDQPPQLRRQCRGDVRRRRSRPRQRCDRQLAAVLPRYGHDRIPRCTNVFRCRTGQGHPDGLPARHLVVGEADRQIQGHHDRRTQLSPTTSSPSVCAGKPPPASSTCLHCGGRCRGPNRSTRSMWRICARQAHRSACVRRRSCPPMAWPRRRWRCRSPSAAPASRSTRWMPTCSQSCIGLSRRHTAAPAGSPPSAVY